MKKPLFILLVPIIITVIISCASPFKYRTLTVVKIIPQKQKCENTAKYKIITSGRGVYYTNFQYKIGDTIKLNNKYGDIF